MNASDTDELAFACECTVCLCRRLERNGKNEMIQKEEEEYRDAIEIQEIQATVQQ